MKGVIFDGRIKKKLNGKIAAKQIGRIVGGIGFMILGSILIG